jgi:hypothetical protein
MFEPNSRYYTIEQATFTPSAGVGAGRPIRYLKRRFIPATQEQTTLVDHTFVEGDRLDTITYRYFGDPTQFWHICDANTVLHPEELAEVGRVIQITLPPVTSPPM